MIGEDLSTLPSDVIIKQEPQCADHDDDDALRRREPRTRAERKRRDMGVILEPRNQEVSEQLIKQEPQSKQLGQDAGLLDDGLLKEELSLEHEVWQQPAPHALQMCKGESTATETHSGNSHSLDKCKLMSKNFTDKQVTCNICNEKLSCKSALTRHHLKHTGERKFSCTVCKKKFALECNQQKHLLSVHSKEQLHICYICAMQFPSKVRLKQHICVHSAKNLKCDTCGRNFLYQGDLTKHLRVHDVKKSYTRVNRDTALSTREQRSRAERNRGDMPVKLEPKNQEVYKQLIKQKPHCKQLVQNEAGGLEDSVYPGDVLKEEVTLEDEVWHQPAPPAVPMCTEAPKPTLKQHCTYLFKICKLNPKYSKKRQVNVTFTCNICDRKFSCKSALARHNLMHTGVRKFKCNICNKNFPVVGSLNAHLLTVHSEKLYICYVCAKQFPSNVHLKEHLQVHSADNQNKCDTCGKNFFCKGDLTYHLRSHDVGKP